MRYREANKALNNSYCCSKNNAKNVTLPSITPKTGIAISNLKKIVSYMECTNAIFLTTEMLFTHFTISESLKATSLSSQMFWPTPSICLLMHSATPSCREYQACCNGSWRGTA